MCNSTSSTFFAVPYKLEVAGWPLTVMPTGRASSAAGAIEEADRFLRERASFHPEALPHGVVVDIAQIPDLARPGPPVEISEDEFKMGQYSIYRHVERRLSHR